MGGRAPRATMPAIMQVALVGPDFEENLSLRYLASSLRRAGHCPTLIAFNDTQDADRAAQAARGFALVGLSICFQARAREFLALASRLKRENPAMVIVAGGHFASCAADEILGDNPAIDAIVIHEGEQAIVELADLCQAKPVSFQAVRGLVYRGSDGAIVRTQPRPAERDLDSLPEPDRSGPTPLCAGIPTAYMLGSRGCVGACTYCCISTLHRLAPGPSFRQRSTEALADEMSRLFHDKAVRHFVFHDDNFLSPSLSANHRRLDALEKALLGHDVKGIAFTIKCRPCDLDPTVMAKLRAMGLIRVFLGIETATTQGLACLGRGHTLAEGERALRLCDDHGVSGQFNILMFHPAATLATVRSDLAFMRRHAHNPLNFCRVEIYAGTPLEQRMLAEGRAVGNYLGRSYSLGDAMADRAWMLAARVFRERCWSTGSLMQMAIGLDHLAALVERCHRARWTHGFRRDVDRWLTDVNAGLLTLLDRIVDQAEQLPTSADLSTDLERWAAPIRSQEQQERNLLLDRYLELRRELHRHDSKTDARSAPSWLRYAAAVALATGAGGCSSSVTLFRPPPPHVQPPSPAEPPAAEPDGGTDLDPPGDIGICEYAAFPLSEKEPTLSSRQVEDIWWAASDQLFDYFDKSKVRLPDTLRVKLRGSITPDGRLRDAKLEDLTGSLDDGFLAGLKRVFESLTYPSSSKRLSVNYKITFDLRRR